MFSKVKEITRKFTPRMGSLKSRDGKVIGDEEGMKSRWKEYSEELYKRIVIIIIIINQGTNARRCPMPFSLFDACIDAPHQSVILSIHSVCGRPLLLVPSNLPNT